MYDNKVCINVMVGSTTRQRQERDDDGVNDNEVCVVCVDVVFEKKAFEKI